MVMVTLSEQNLDKHKRLVNARIALESLSVGDAFGDQFFMHEDDALEAINNRELPQVMWKYTDDALMAMSIVEVLYTHGEIDQDALANSFAKRLDKSRGYGAGALRQLIDIQDGGDWRELSQARYGGMGSAGNGSAMRVAPLGAYFYDNLSVVVEQAQLSSEVTHMNNEAIAGAIAVAVASALMFRYSGKTKLIQNDFIQQIIDHVPDSEVRAKLQLALNLPDSASVRLAVSALGNGSKLLAVDTVPFAIWCVSRQYDNFKEAMWTVVSALGDRDTNCAIAGGIIAGYVGLDGIPQQWIASREPLPKWIDDLYD